MVGKITITQLIWKKMINQNFLIQFHVFFHCNKNHDIPCNFKRLSLPN